MKMTFLKSTVCAALLAGAMAPVALSDDGEGPWDLSGSLTVTNDYRFRGVSQTSGGGAVQLGVELAHESGFYGGVWFSNVDFDAFADVETDLYLGYVHAISESTELDLAALYYLYNDEPAGGDYDFLELMATLTHTYEGGVEVYGLVALAPNYFGDTGFGWNIEGGVAFPIVEWLSISGAVGYHDVEHLGAYTNWNVGLTASWEIIDFDARYVDTDISGACDDVCDGTVVLSATLNL